MEVRNATGYLASRIVFYLMNLHTQRRTIYFARAGRSMNATYKSDEGLSEEGRDYAGRLAKRLVGFREEEGREEVMLGERPRKLTVFTLDTCFFIDVPCRLHYLLSPCYFHILLPPSLHISLPPSPSSTPPLPSNHLLLPFILQAISYPNLTSPPFPLPFYKTLTPTRSGHQPASAQNKPHPISHPQSLISHAQN